MVVTLGRFKIETRLSIGIPPNRYFGWLSRIITSKSRVNCSKMRLHIAIALAALAVTAEPVTGFTASSSKTPSPRTTTPSTTPRHPVMVLQWSPKDDDDQHESNRRSSMSSTLAAAALGVILSTAGMFGGGIAFAADGATTTSYDGFAEYAKENQMEKSDVGCFINKCGDQTKQLFSNPRGIKGITCLGRCKGEQSCAVRCFSEFGSEDLNNWLSCTIEENDCVKVPKNIDTTAENVGYTTTVKKFDPSLLVGTWYKTNGLNPNYDLFDCQSNSFKATAADSSELDMDIFLRVNRPDEAGGGFWENALSEHMVVDAVLEPNQAEGSRTMHTEGKMNGLTFDENWYILGQSDGKGSVPAFVLVAYKGHTLQGGYEGSFVYSKEPVLPAAAVPAVKEAATKAGLNWDDYQQIDNTWYVRHE